MPAFDEIVRQAERSTRLMRWSSLEEVVPADLFYSALCLADVNLMFGRRSERRQRRGLQIWHHLREPAWINGHIGTQDHARANTLRSTHACTRTLRATSRCQWSRASTRVGVGVRARFAVAPVFNSIVSRLPYRRQKENANMNAIRISVRVNCDANGQMQADPLPPPPSTGTPPFHSTLASLHLMYISILQRLDAIVDPRAVPTQPVAVPARTSLVSMCLQRVMMEREAVNQKRKLSQYIRYEIYIPPAQMFGRFGDDGSENRCRYPTTSSI